jgi:hypothetical protein
MHELNRYTVHDGKLKHCFDGKLVEYKDYAILKNVLNRILTAKKKYDNARATSCGEILQMAREEYNEALGEAEYYASK